MEYCSLYSGACEEPEECSSRIVLFGCLKDQEVQMVSTRAVTCFDGLMQKCLLCPCRSHGNVCASVVKRIPDRRLCDDVFSYELNIANNTSFSSHQRVSEGEEPPKNICQLSACSIPDTDTCLLFLSPTSAADSVN